MKPHSGWVRALLASAAIACAIGLAGCQTDGMSPLTSARAMAPLSPEMLTLLEQKNMPKESPILVRIFKEEAEMEVWKQDAAGQYALLKTYPICRWSGELGPKIKEGDRQAPEGFYAITPGQMNPNSNWYLSFNLGFPNAYDRANGRTGAFLMVHGDCSSAGCYAMTDEQMGEIYALGREAFFGGQKSFQVQAYPFRMTAANLARHRNNPAMPFWRMIKEGNDIFELTRQEPKVDVCEKRYVFAAESSGHFDPKGRCPAYTVPDQIASALSEKQQRDERDFANLAARGTPTAPIKTGSDGGMNKIFLAKLRSQDKFDEGGRIFSLASTARVPDMGNNVNPPKGSLDGDAASAAVAPPPARVASADGGGVPPSAAGSQGGTAASANAIDRVSRWLGFGASEAAPPPPPTAAPVAKSKPASESKAAPRPAAGAIRPAQAAPPVERKPATAPTPPAAVPASAAAQPAPPPTPPALIAGAQPVISSNSFETRWSAWH